MSKVTNPVNDGTLCKCMRDVELLLADSEPITEWRVQTRWKSFKTEQALSYRYIQTSEQLALEFIRNTFDSFPTSTMYLEIAKRISPWGQVCWVSPGPHQSSKSVASRSGQYLSEQ